MNITKKHRFAKTVVGTAVGISLLSLSLISPASLLQPTHTAYAATVSATTKAAKIIQTGKRFMGVRYVFGAKSGRTNAFDCSSFTQYVYKQHGVSLPRTSKQQSKAGKYVPKSQLKPGDLVFFYSPIHHVAIYLGNGKILHTYGKPGVTISNMNSGWWKNHYSTARRVL
ncbi:C40 family peptidase [Paenibacillus eucommiae]|uniref:Cell wall-associated NlpC family hydrolase n=1 Tax=Paenibacillus eucommiae TaxID=1355755 RepID=A0ABS4IQX2_9BACL|nr:C40 family peptidase [Paenibacillus eucommiae]MBP1989964.1 cell wall-associated NlpC family hydrolase [Paenibacillus eucommiae]